MSWKKRYGWDKQIMFSLPPAKKEWQCKITGKNGNPCDQWIYQSDTLKYQSGKYKVLNAADGRGGLRNEPHVCPDRVGSEFHKVGTINMLEYRWHLQHMPCVICGQQFNQERCPVCPNCFRFVCRKCPNQQSWIIIEGRESSICNLCGARCDCMQVFHSYDRIRNG